MGQLVAFGFIMLGIWRFFRLHFVRRNREPEKPVAEALEMMGREDVNKVPLVQQDKLAGIISRAHILRVLQARAELDV